jgi:hypothetical protein
LSSFNSQLGSQPGWDSQLSLLDPEDTDEDKDEEEEETVTSEDDLESLTEFNFEDMIDEDMELLGDAFGAQVYSSLAL